MNTIRLVIVKKIFSFIHSGQQLEFGPILPTFSSWPQRCMCDLDELLNHLMLSFSLWKKKRLITGAASEGSESNENKIHRKYL